MVTGGAETNVFVARRRRNRGIRRPRHLGGMYGLGQRRLQPWLAHPLRPGETLLDVSVQGESWFNSIVQLPMAPMLYSECALWLVPMSALPDWFSDIFTEDVSDISRKGGGEYLRGAAIARDDETDEGLQNIGMDERVRAWAGELGTGDDASAYVPYTSRSTIRVARDWYGLATSIDYDDAAFDDEAPFVSNYIEGARLSSLGVPAESPILDPQPNTTTSWWEMIDAMFITNTIERTYADYLAANGIDPRRVEGMSRPVAMSHDFFQAQENPQLIHGYAIDNAVAGEGTALFDQYSLTDMPRTPADNNDGVYYANQPIGALKNQFGFRRRRNILIEEPSILLGTYVYYTNDIQANAGRSMDISYLAHAGHWGDRSYGDVDEQDFMDVRQFGDRDGALVAGGPYMQNMLHLYLHGDTFLHHPDTFTNPLEFREPGGSLWSSINRDVTFKASAQLSIASDLVGGA
jgi:hypothetical protein